MAAATAVRKSHRCPRDSCILFLRGKPWRSNESVWRRKRKRGAIYVLKQSNAWPEPNDFVATRYPPPHLREQNKYGSDNPVLFSHNNTEDLSAPLYCSLSRARSLFSNLFVMRKQKLWPVTRPRPVHILKQPIYSSGGYVRCATAASSSARLSTDTSAHARALTDNLKSSTQADWQTACTCQNTALFHQSLYVFKSRLFGLKGKYQCLPKIPIFLTVKLSNKNTWPSAYLHRPMAKVCVNKLHDTSDFRCA